MGLRDLSDSSDDELLPVSTLQPWQYRGSRSPVKAKERIVDPAEQSIISPTIKRKLHSKTSYYEIESRVGASSAVSSSKKGESGKQPPPPLKTTRSDSETAKRTANSKGKAREARDVDILEDTTGKSSRESSIVPDSENELEVAVQGGFAGLNLDAPKLQSKIFGQEWTSSPVKNAHSRHTADLLAPAVPVQPKAAQKVVQKKDKHRRLTIITILDSDEEADLQAAREKEEAPPTPALSASSSSGSVNTSYGENTPDEVSFADYSDKEEEVAKKKASPPPFELDSSDSDYDCANGVLSWAPTPNKTKLLQPTPRKPLASIPSRLFNSDANSARKLPSASKRRIIESDSSEGEDDLVVLATPKPSDKSKGKPKPSTSQPVKTALQSPIKKPSKAAFARERDALAQKLIQELDEAVFEGQLPKELTIVWNGRLNTTAGRASWKKITKKPSNTVTFKAEIELSVKVIDCEEKLKCTLAHELCHIAAWAVEGEMKPAHGPAFKGWGRKIMSARKDITVTTKHSYEIAYKYNWQCDSSLCGKIYGRHSKSIDPTKQACGVCSGMLVQLDKEGNKISNSGKGGTGTPRKESEWTLFYKDAFKRVKADNAGLSMTQINKLVAEEWQAHKGAKAKTTLQSSSLVDQLHNLQL